MTSLHSSPNSTSNPEVVLVFPPLVETNFGSYYPSIAVLAGYLKSKGIEATQIDLNEDFARNILQSGSLDCMARGIFGDNLSFTPDSMPAVAARLLTRYGHLLIDEQGKHLFREDCSDLAYLLNIVVEPLKIDVSISDISSNEIFLQPRAIVYRTLFEKTDSLRNLPSNIHTVGISIAVGPQLVPALILARHLKAASKDIAVVIGGPVISLMDLGDIEKVLISNPEVDAAVRSDGEYPLEILIKNKRAGDWEPSQVLGVSCRVGSKVVHRAPERGPDLDSIPYAHYDTKLLARLAKPEIGILQSRGCYWGRCAYCDYNELYKGNPNYRARSPNNFVDEMEYQIKKHGIQNISVITEAISPAAARKISQLILKKGIKVKWHSFAMIDKRFTKDVFEALVKSGCEYLVIGVETMANRVLNFMNKAANSEETVRFILDAKECGLDLKLNLIPDLPSTTYQEAMDTLELVEKRQDCFIYVSPFPFEATRSSSIGRNPETFGLRVIDSDSTSGQAQFALNHLEVFDPAMNAKEREHVFAEYHAFAARVNNRGVIDASSDVVDQDDLNNIYFRLADEYLDFVKVGSEIQCYHWLKRKRYQMPEEWPEIIAKMRFSKKFNKTDFINWLPTTDSGKFYFDKLLEMGILTRYQHKNSI
ncbi:MAG: radical SAM protein [Dehalococcoidia bacterium]|nr:MAG: radical SAM protein [Dehalococcoidia bacterium]